MILAKVFARIKTINFRIIIDFYFIIENKVVSTIRIVMAMVVYSYTLKKVTHSKQSCVVEIISILVNIH